MERKYRRPSALALLALAGAALAPPAWPHASAHPGPPVFLQMKVREDGVTLIVSGEQQAVLPWLGMQAPLLPPLAAAQERALFAAAQALLEEELPLVLDGASRRGALRAVRVFPDFGPSNLEPAVELELEYASAERPRSVSLEWPLFGRTPDESAVKLPLVVEAGTEFDFVTLLAEEPGWTWHAREHAPRPAAQPEPLHGEAPAVPELPLASIAVALLCLPLVFARRPARRARLALGGAGFALAFLLVPFARVAAPWAPRVAMPSHAQALAMFEILHRNVYRAFAARSEDEIYEVLAACVDARLLDELYGEVYESLILRDEGGAVCSVEEVVVLDGAASLPETGEAAADALSFGVDWSWEVTGTVTHYGHQHTRTNRYRALYTVAHDGDSWKIREVETLLHERAQDGGSFLEVAPGAAPEPELLEEAEEDPGWESFLEDEEDGEREGSAAPAQDGAAADGPGGAR